MSDKITVGVALIVGPNRLEQVKRLLPQLCLFDQVVVVNTSGQGSVNNYVKNLAKKHKGVYEIHDFTWRPTPYTGTVRSLVGTELGAASEGNIGPNGVWRDGEYREMYDLNDWGFSAARNESFRYLKTTHALWLDTDDLIGVKYQGKDVPLPAKAAAETFRKIAREAPDVDVWFMDYTYAKDDEGNTNVIHARERMIRMECGWGWVYPIHECLVPGRAPKHSVVSDIQIIHMPEPKVTGSSAERNMGMLKDWYKQLETMPRQHDMQRCRLQIGETLWGMERFREASDWLENVYLHHHPDAIGIEKWQAACFACKSYIQCGNLTGARRMALLAIDLESGLMDGYLLLAEIKLLAEEDPQDILHLLDVGGRMDDPPPQVIRNPLDYTFTPFCITSEAKFQQGQYEGALDFAVKALKVRPNDDRAERLRVKAAHKLREKEATRATMALYQYLSDFDEHEKAAQLFRFLPYPVQRQLEVHKIAEGADKRVQHILSPEKYVAYYEDPPNWEPTPWDGFEKGYVPGRDRYEYVLSRLRRHPDIRRVLVAGCDDGFHSILLAQAGYDVVGIDLNKEAIRIATERAEKLGVTAKFQQGWFEKIDPEELGWLHAFDAVISSDQIDRVRDVAFYLETLGDCAKDGAPIIITTPDGAWDAGDIPFNRTDPVPHAVRTFQQDQFEQLLKNPDYHVTECHHLDYKGAYREGQGWLVGELARRERPKGPIIRLFCGEMVEPFSPESLETGGIGGSETAVIHMASEWAKNDCIVGVYGNKIGIYDGVFYRHADDFSFEMKSDIFISWRLPQLFAKGRPDAGITVLWCHDIHYPVDILPEWVENIDIICVLSEFHKKWIMDIHPFPEEKVWVTRNGIDPQRYAPRAATEDIKVPHSYFFSSSHERGLEELLLLWPKVKKAIPDATLHVGYGTYTAAMIMKDRRDYGGLDELRGLEQLMYDTEGIIYHGRMNQRELAQVQLECEAWLYPYQSDPKWEGKAGFLETSCITKFEAMAAGCIPFTRLNGALPENLPHCIEWTKEMGDEDVIEILKKPHWKQSWTEENRRTAFAWSWESLAIEWLQHFNQHREKHEQLPEPIGDLAGATAGN